MAQTTVQISMDEDLRNAFDDFCSDIGMNMTTAFEGIGKPEPLRGNLSTYWSRRIDDCNRIVYKIENNIIKIVQCGSHYREK